LNKKKLFALELLLLLLLHAIAVSMQFNLILTSLAWTVLLMMTFLLAVMARPRQGSV